MWLKGLVAPRHVGSSQTRARTRVPCIGRQILNHCATREAPPSSCFNGRECKPSFSSDFPKSPRSRPRYLEWTKSHFMAMASDGGYRRLPTSLCALTGSADQGTKGPRNSDCPQESQVTGGTQRQGPGQCRPLFRRWAEAAQLHFVQSLPVFKIVVKMLH